MKVNLGAGIRNEFRIVVEDIKTGKTDEYKAYNLVLNQMWTRLVNFQTYFVNIHYGTGTGTLAATRTTLFTHRGTKAATTELQARALPTSKWVRKIVLNPEEEVGQTLTEVGVAFGATNTNLVTHAFIKDAEGNPISLTKTDTQVITIYATMFYTLTANSSYDDKIRLVQPLSNNEWLSYLMGATYPTQQFRVTRAPEFSNGTAPTSHGSSPNVLVADWIKDAANKKVTTPVRRLGVSVGNGEVRGFGLGSSDALGTFRGQFPITGVFTSKAITGESLGSGDGAKVGFNPTWIYANISAVKIDDVAVDSGDYDLAVTKKGTNLLLGKTVQVIVDDATNPVSPSNLTDNNISTNSFLPTGVEIGIDVGAMFAVDTFRLYHSYISAGLATFQIRGSSNPDFSDSVLLGTVGSSLVVGWNEITFTPASYRYYHIVSISSGGIRTYSQIQLLTAANQITFHTPPANGAVITADYTVPYVPKDSNHVLDLQATIQYGEIV